MMKRITKQDIHQLPEDRVFWCGYCGAQEIESLGHYLGYGHGTYGWNYSLYEFIVKEDGELKRYYLVTGYRPTHYGRMLTEEDVARIKRDAVKVY